MVANSTCEDKATMRPRPMLIYDYTMIKVVDPSIKEHVSEDIWTIACFLQEVGKRKRVIYLVTSQYEGKNMNFQRRAIYNPVRAVSKNCESCKDITM